jgi:hypothetical protein
MFDVVKSYTPGDICCAIGSVEGQHPSNGANSHVALAYSIITGPFGLVHANLCELRAIFSDRNIQPVDS